MGNDFDFICPKCNYNISQHKSKSYNPRKRITQLRLKRGKSLNRLLTKLIRLIKENIPSENDTIKEYYFMKNIENVQANQNVLELKNEILENSYKIKSIRLELDGEYK